MAATAITVTAAEAGQKLLQFLTRRLDLPSQLLHRWIRTGQVRINGGRCKPFDRVAQGDEVRVPPFAHDMAAEARAQGGDHAAPAAVANGDESRHPRASTQMRGVLTLPPVVHTSDHLFVFNKPAGLAVHPGTGHTDSVTTRLAVHCAADAFAPTPAHRLDRETSGLLLVARSYAMLRSLNEAFAARDSITKEYLAWVEGTWPAEGPQRMEDKLAKRADATGYEKVRTGDGDAAAATVWCLQRHRQHSLLLIRLHTGRTHQIRVQLASRGHPIAGDHKYGGKTTGQGLLLHAARLVLPDGTQHTCLPPWKEPFAVVALPELARL